jgi:hypothetical protein
MVQKIAEVNPIVVEENQEAADLAREYVSENVLSWKSLNDCLHIALSALSSCDYLVSWNFRHLVNVRTVEGVRKVNAIKHYKEIMIVSPNMFLKKEEL